MSTDDDKTTNDGTVSGKLTGTITGLWPQLTEDQKAELRTAAPQLVAASRTASDHANKIAKVGAQGIWQGLALSAASSLACLASGVALLGASVAWLACGDGEADRDAKPNNTDSNAAPAATKGE